MDLKFAALTVKYWIASKDTLSSYVTNMILKADLPQIGDVSINVTNNTIQYSIKQRKILLLIYEKISKGSVLT